MPLTDAILKEWAMKDLWCESELQEFCCGLEPNRSRPETVQSELNEASEAILRGVLSKELKCIEPDDADRSDRLYGHARFFKPINAIPWASARFPRFPKFSLDLSKTKLTMVDQPHLHRTASTGPS